ncbi:MAG: hypothetical protein WKF57_01415 [Nakamurella sp.]
MRYRQLLDTALRPPPVSASTAAASVNGCNHTLLSHRTGNAHRLPSFQFTDDGELPGWSKVAPHVAPSWHPVAVERFFTSTHVDLVLDDRNVSPREWLLAGGPPESVAALAGE